MRWENAETPQERVLVLSLRDFAIKLYAEHAAAPEFELFIEKVLGFMTRSADLQVSIVTKAKSGEGTSGSVFYFANKESLSAFVEKFGKARTISESSLQHIMRLPPTEAWLGDFAPDEDRLVGGIRAKAHVFKVLAQSDPDHQRKKYLIFPRGEGRLIVTTNPVYAQHVVTLTDIAGVGGDLGNLTFTYKEGGRVSVASFVMGSLREALLAKALIMKQLCPVMLLLPSEPRMKTQMMSVYAITFNMNRCGFEGSVERLFANAKDSQLACVCLQEVPLMNRGGVTKAVAQHFRSLGLELVAQDSMWEMALMVFAGRSVLGLVSGVEKQELTAGFLSVVGNKGGLVIALDIMSTKFAVAGVHLKHGQKSLKARDETLWDLFSSLQIGSAEVPLCADHCIFLGDTNYRIDHDFSEVLNEVNRSNYQFLMKLDQLQTERTQGRVLCGFQVSRSHTVVRV